jgi:hypothetical protein
VLEANAIAYRREDPSGSRNRPDEPGLGLGKLSDFAGWGQENLADWLGASQLLKILKNFLIAP